MVNIYFRKIECVCFLSMSTATNFSLTFTVRLAKACYAEHAVSGMLTSQMIRRALDQIGLGKASIIES